MELSQSSFDFIKLLSLNQIFFQDHLFISSINLVCILIILYRNGVFFNRAIGIQRLLFLLSTHYFYFYYIIFLVKSTYSLSIYYYLLVIYLLIFKLYSLFVFKWILIWFSLIRWFINYEITELFTINFTLPIMLLCNQ